MNLALALFLVFGFVAVVLLIEGVYVYWSDNKSPEVVRLRHRLRAISTGGYDAVESPLLKQRVMSQSAVVQALLEEMRPARWLDRLLQQAGASGTVARLVALCGFFAVGGLALGLLMGWPWPILLPAALGLGFVPILRLMRKRGKRLRLIEAQLPEAMDLIGRALRAGHAFPSALAMVGAEAQEPIAGEFKIASEEIAFGIPLDNALNSLADRVESVDMRYFVMAVIIQRETGGNLAELLDKLSHLVRERFALFAKVRALSAEGKLSAWILTGLPFCVAAAIQVINPQYLSLLFTDPVGIRMVMAALAMIAMGIFVMWRIIDIRV